MVTLNYILVFHAENCQLCYIGKQCHIICIVEGETTNLNHNFLMMSFTEA